ncbi:MAG: tetratricopeptide repeat protein [bacterium]
MSIKGNLKEASLPDVIQLLSLGKKTGVLSISDRKNFGDIFFENGKIVYCSIVNRENRIGQILLNHNDIDKATLQKALEYQTEHKNQRIGDILIEMGFITKERLEERMAKQITDTIFTFLTWEEGFFNFEPDISPDEETITVKLDPDDILLEQARKVDEWSVIEEEIPQEDTVLMKTNMENIERLQDDEKHVLEIINNRYTLKELFEKSSLGKYETAKAVYNLKKAGYVYEGEKKDMEQSVSDQQKINEHYNLGLAFLFTEMYEEALREFKQIVQIDKTNTTANFYIGMIYFRTSRYKQALSAFENLLKLGVDNVALLNNTALTLEKLGNHERAEEFYDRAIKMDPENSKLLANYGILSYFENLLTEAEERLKMALKIDPSLNYARFYLGLVYVENGKIEQSLDEFLKVTKKDPGVWQVYYNIGQIYITLNKNESAEYMLNKALENSNKDIRCYKALVNLHFMEKNFSAAEKILEEAIQAHSEEFEFYYKMGNLKYKKMDKESAVYYWEKALSLQPNNQILKKTLDTVKNG